MESIKQIYRIGHGPSSSHTMGADACCPDVPERNRGAVRFNVTLLWEPGGYRKRPHDGCGNSRSVEPGGQDQYHLGTEGVPAFSSERHPLPVV